MLDEDWRVGRVHPVRVPKPSAVARGQRQERTEGV
jgi:hypothetical protein